MYVNKSHRHWIESFKFNDFPDHLQFWKMSLSHTFTVNHIRYGLMIVFNEWGVIGIVPIRKKSIITITGMTLTFLLWLVHLEIWSKLYYTVCTVIKKLFMRRLLNRLFLKKFPLPHRSIDGEHRNKKITSQYRYANLITLAPLKVFDQYVCLFIRHRS